MPWFSNLSLDLLPAPGHAFLKASGNFLLPQARKKEQMSSLGTNGWGRAAYPKPLCSTTPPLSRPSAVPTVSSVCKWFQVPSLAQPDWLHSLVETSGLWPPRLDSRNCPAQWTCIFPLVLFMNAVFLPADYQPLPRPHPPLVYSLVLKQITLLQLPAGRSTTPLFTVTDSPSKFGAAGEVWRPPSLSLALNPQLSGKKCTYSRDFKKSASDSWFLKRDLRL